MDQESSHDNRVNSRLRVQDALAEAYFSGSSKSKLGELRAELAKQLDLTKAQVTAFGAWPIIYSKKILKQHGLDSAVEPQNLVALEKYLSFGQERASFDPLQVQEALEVFSISNVDALVITKCLQSLSDRLRRTTASVCERDERIITSSADDPKGPTIHHEVLPQSQIIVGDKSETITRRMNYGFPAKNFWRQKWIDFIENHLPPSERHRARVLCLPSVECECELSLYKKIGIDPSNIVAVESDRSVWDEFYKRVTAFGARPVFGDLRDLAPKFHEDFKVIALDFMGQYSFKTLEILTHLPTASRTILMTNHRCARENRAIQGQLFIDEALTTQNLYAQVCRALDNQNSILGSLANFFRAEKKKFDRFSAGDFSLSQDSLAAARRYISLGPLHNLGRFRQDRLIDSTLVDELWRTSPSPEGKKYSCLYGAIKSLEETLLTFAVSSVGQAKFPDWMLLPPLVHFTAFRLPLPKVAESWEYKTSGASGHTFISQFVVVDRPVDTYKRWDKAIKPGLDLFLHYAQHPEFLTGREVRVTLEESGRRYRTISSSNFRAFVERPPRELLVGCDGKKFNFHIPDLKRATRELKQLLNNYPQLNTPIDPESIEEAMKLHK